jgi:hypothetical protein
MLPEKGSASFLTFIPNPKDSHMNMKRVLPALFAATLVGLPAAQASENETIFLPAQGKLVIPHLRLNNEIYFVILNRTPNPAVYNFTVQAPTITRITPQPGDDWATAAEVVGDWVITGLPGIRLGIFGSGSYSMTTPADEDCAAGAETGTWTLDEETGVFFAVAQSDTNGECGLSHPDGALRFKRVGANLEAILTESENGVQQTVQLTLTPG